MNAVYLIDTVITKACPACAYHTFSHTMLSAVRRDLTRQLIGLDQIEIAIGNHLVQDVQR